MTWTSRYAWGVADERGWDGAVWIVKLAGRPGPGHHQPIPPPLPIPPPQVPLLGTCQLVQRMVLAERRRMAAEMAALRKENAHLRAAASGAAAVAEQ